MQYGMQDPFGGLAHISDNEESVGPLMGLTTVPPLPAAVMPITIPVPVPMAATTTVTHMPRPCSHEAPHFKGKKINKFLHEFELQAQSARLTNEQRCEYIVLYCKEKEAKFIQTLSGYLIQDWLMLKDDLQNFYPAEQEDKVYQIRDLRWFVQ